MEESGIEKKVVTNIHQFNLWVQSSVILISMYFYQHQFHSYLCIKDHVWGKSTPLFHWYYLPCPLDTTYWALMGKAFMTFESSSSDQKLQQMTQKLFPLRTGQWFGVCQACQEVAGWGTHTRPQVSVPSENTSYFWDDDQVCFWWCLKPDALKDIIEYASDPVFDLFKSVNILSTQYCSRNFPLWNYLLTSFYHRRVTNLMLCHPPKSHESPVWVQNTRCCLAQTHNQSCDVGPLTGDSYHELIPFTFLFCRRQGLSFA